MTSQTNRNLIIEVAIVTIALVAVTSLLQSLASIPVIKKYYGLVFALMFLYVPVVVYQRRGRRIDFLDRGLPALLRSVFTFVTASVIIFPIFLLAAHWWEKIVYSSRILNFAVFPDFWKAAAFQFIMIALPEEFFFRGYVQTTLNLVFPRKWRVLGADIGWGLIITAAVFAFAHSFVLLQWWHFAIFFPALLFGYLREKTGSITASVLFHGTANLTMAWLGYVYVQN